MILALLMAIGFVMWVTLLMWLMEHPDKGAAVLFGACLLYTAGVLGLEGGL